MDGHTRRSQGLRLLPLFSNAVSRAHEDVPQVQLLARHPLPYDFYWR